MVHRDIKPENILLQDGAALVADFGIALAVQQAGGSRMTQTGMSLGTPAYMSPEQAMGEREIGARSDVYALGAMTYEMLAGEPPFTGPNSQAIVAKVLTEQPPPLRPKRPTVPPAAEAAILTALQKLPADRWGTAREFSDALTGAGSRSGSAPTVPMAAARAPAGSRRAPLLWAGWMLAGITAAVAAWALQPAAAGAPAVPAPAHPGAGPGRELRPRGSDGGGDACQHPARPHSGARREPAGARAAAIRTSGPTRFAAPAPVSASLNSRAEPQRSAGSFCSAVRIAASRGGTVGRLGRSGGGCSVSTLATIACELGPVNGGSPASIS